MKVRITILSLCISFNLFAQEDSLDDVSLRGMITLSDVMISKDFNVPRFIDLVKKDTTFYMQFYYNPIAENKQRPNICQAVFSPVKILVCDEASAQPDPPL